MSQVKEAGGYDIIGDVHGCARASGTTSPTHTRSASNRLLLIEAGSPWPDAGQVGGLEDEVCDAIEASREMDLVPLIEEEILLALPISPKHERCERPESVAASVEGSPFARLARLKRS